MSSAENAAIPLQNPAEENTRIRRQLALAYRLIDRLELNEGACNHLTAIAPAKNGNGQVMLVVPGIIAVLPISNPKIWSNELFHKLEANHS